MNNVAENEKAKILSEFSDLIEVTLSKMVEKTSKQENEFLSLIEVCEFFGISRITLRRWIKKGKFKVISISPKKNYIRRSEIMSVIETSQVKERE